MRTGIAMPRLALYTLLLVATAATAPAQFRRFGGGPQEYYDSNLQVATSRPAAQLFENAKRDLESGELERAVRYIQQVLDEHGTAAHIATDTRFEGVRDHAHAFLAALPEKGMATYRNVCFNCHGDNSVCRWDALSNL